MKGRVEIRFSMSDMPPWLRDRGFGVGGMLMSL